MTDELARAEIEAKINSSKNLFDESLAVCGAAESFLSGESTMMELSMSWEQKVRWSD